MAIVGLKVWKSQALSDIVLCAGCSLMRLKTIARLRKRVDNRESTHNSPDVSHTFPINHSFNCLTHAILLSWAGRSTEKIICCASGWFVRNRTWTLRISKAFPSILTGTLTRFSETEFDLIAYESFPLKALRWRLKSEVWTNKSVIRIRFESTTVYVSCWNHKVSRFKSVKLPRNVLARYARATLVTAVWTFRKQRENTTRMREGWCTFVFEFKELLSRAKRLCQTDCSVRKVNAF